jgi:hypothetical protein
VQHAPDEERHERSGPGHKGHHDARPLDAHVSRLPGLTLELDEAHVREWESTGCQPHQPLGPGRAGRRRRGGAWRLNCVALGTTEPQFSQIRSANARPNRASSSMRSSSLDGSVTAMVRHEVVTGLVLWPRRFESTAVRFAAGTGCTWSDVEREAYVAIHRSQSAAPIDAQWGQSGSGLPSTVIQARRLTLRRLMTRKEWLAQTHQSGTDVNCHASS